MSQNISAAESYIMQNDISEVSNLHCDIYKFLVCWDNKFVIYWISLRVVVSNMYAKYWYKNPFENNQSLYASKKTLIYTFRIMARAAKKPFCS